MTTDDQIKALARLIAKDLFEMGSEIGGVECYRIEFKSNPDDEIGQGGLTEEPFARFIEKELKRYLPLCTLHFGARPKGGARSHVTPRGS